MLSLPASNFNERCDLYSVLYHIVICTLFLYPIVNFEYFIHLAQSRQATFQNLLLLLSCKRKRIWARRKTQISKAHAKHRAYTCLWQRRSMQKHQTLFSATNAREKELSPECHSLSLDKDTAGMKRGVSPVAQPGSAVRASSFCSTPDRQSRPKAPVPWDISGKPALPDQHSEGYSL